MGKEGEKEKEGETGERTEGRDKVGEEEWWLGGKRRGR